MVVSFFVQFFVTAIASFFPFMLAGAVSNAQHIGGVIWLWLIMSAIVSLFQTMGRIKR